MSSEAPVTVRLATPADHPFILSLLARFAENRPPWRSAEQIETRAEQELLVSFGEGKDMVAVAEDEQRRPLGFVRLAIKADFLTLGPRGYVAELAVLPQAEGGGAARALMGMAEEWARALKLEMLSLHVFAENHRARHFYEKLGFQPEVVEYVKMLEYPSDD
ncbi:MAG: hypothetical protein Kow0031_02520 [Anaerolineae bacterium]